MQQLAEAGTVMAKQPKRRGRPKTTGRITFRYAIVASPEMRAWMEEYRKFLGKQDVSDVYRDSVRRCAIEDGFRAPPIL